MTYDTLIPRDGGFTPEATRVKRPKDTPPFIPTQTRKRYTWTLGMIWRCCGCNSEPTQSITPLKKLKPPPNKEDASDPKTTMASTAHLDPHPRVGASLASLLGAPIGLSPPRLVPPSARPRVRVDVVGRSLGQSFRWCLG